MAYSKRAWTIPAFNYGGKQLETSIAYIQILDKLYSQNYRELSHEQIICQVGLMQTLWRLELL
jgi:hypothetical protein